MSTIIEIGAAIWAAGKILEAVVGMLALVAIALTLWSCRR